MVVALFPAAVVPRRLKDRELGDQTALIIQLSVLSLQKANDCQSPALCSAPLVHPGMLGCAVGRSGWQSPSSSLRG